MVFKKRGPLFLFLIPATVFMLVYLYYPFVFNVAFSFARMKATSDSPFEVPNNGQEAVINQNGTVVWADGDIIEPDISISAYTAVYFTKSDWVDDLDPAAQQIILDYIETIKSGASETDALKSEINAYNGGSSLVLSPEVITQIKSGQPAAGADDNGERVLLSGDLIEFNDDGTITWPGGTVDTSVTPAVAKFSGSSWKDTLTTEFGSYLKNHIFGLDQKVKELDIFEKDNGLLLTPKVLAFINDYSFIQVNIVKFQDMIAAKKAEIATLSDPEEINAANYLIDLYEDEIATLTAGTKPLQMISIALGKEDDIDHSGDKVVLRPKDGSFGAVVAGSLQLPNVDRVVLVGPSYDGANLFRNYTRLFTDPNMLTSYKNTFIMMLCTLIFQVGLAIVLAILVDAIPRGAEFFRTIYFFPIVISATALGALFLIIFKYSSVYPKDGLLNGLIVSLFGGTGVNFFEGNNIYIPMLVPVVWQYIGFYFVILATGLNNISMDIYEAARIDGVNPMQRVTYITLPLLRNTICTCVTLGITGSLKVFDLPYVLLGTEAGGGKGWLMATYMNKMSGDVDVDFAATIGIAMVILGVVVSQLANKVFSQRDY
jgi:raffinose/stachyose/melibiose transport system permease protein